ncbi:hypothetical protein GWN15_27225 [candidate division KSB1 bacterium]|nr:hypothetical protein [candidate division KSB1 bacterium]NIW72517.1 hypothetical protein [candidate division KSB1 bacterium]
MRHRKVWTGLGIMVALLFFTSSVASAVPGISGSRDAQKVDPWFVEGVNKDQVVLQPGNTAYCNKRQFRVENMGEDSAEIHVIMGNGANYIWEKLEPKSMKTYSTQDKPTLFAQEDVGEAVTIQESRIVNGTAGDSRLKVYCE